MLVFVNEAPIDRRYKVRSVIKAMFSTGRREEFGKRALFRVGPGTVVVPNEDLKALVPLTPKTPG
jgi:hypothetical protein